MSSQKYLIRKMTKDDIKEVQELHLILFPVVYSYNVFLSFLDYSYVSLVIETEWYGEKRLVGVSTVSREWLGLFTRARRAYLSTFGIRPEFRRKNLGTILLKVTEACMSHYFGCDELALHMLNTNNAAYEFYTKNGLIVQKLLPRHYTFDNKKHDALYLTKHIKNSKLPQQENITYSEYVEELANNKQYVTWFQRYCMDP